MLSKVLFVWSSGAERWGLGLAGPKAFYSWAGPEVEGSEACAGDYSPASHSTRNAMWRRELMLWAARKWRIVARNCWLTYSRTQGANMCQRWHWCCATLETWSCQRRAERRGPGCPGVSAVMMLRDESSGPDPEPETVPPRHYTLNTMWRRKLRSQQSPSPLRDSAVQCSVHWISGSQSQLATRSPCVLIFVCSILSSLEMKELRPV